ncbi:glycoside hydrolase [Infundibulicybe gibba]|nr:glycoside hydrolase [Infundibulicybe gibba]
MHVLIFASLLANSAALASAHGFVSTVTINGKAFTGTLGPLDQPASSIIRQVSDPNPIKGAHNPAVNCGRDARASALVAAADPGSTITFDWTGADLKNWPHNTGPMLTYMAACGSTTCDKFDSTQAKWFKIQQDGRQSDGQWAQANLSTQQHSNARTDIQFDHSDWRACPARIPINIAAGDYLIRHEIIALHLATDKGGAEFYVSCTQLRVGETEQAPRPPGIWSVCPGI